MKRSPRWPRFIRSLELFTNEAEMQVNVLNSGHQRVNRGFFENLSKIRFHLRGKRVRLAGVMLAATAPYKPMRLTSEPYAGWRCGRNTTHVHKRRP